MRPDDRPAWHCLLVCLLATFIHHAEGHSHASMHVYARRILPPGFELHGAACTLPVLCGECAQSHACCCLLHPIPLPCGGTSKHWKWLVAGHGTAYAVAPKACAANGLTSYIHMCQASALHLDFQGSHVAGVTLHDRHIALSCNQFTTRHIAGHMESRD